MAILHKGDNDDDDDDDNDNNNNNNNNNVNGTAEHAWCSLISESSYLGRYNQPAKIIHQQTAIKEKLLDGNAPPHSRYKPEPVFIPRDMSIVIGKTVHFNRRCTALTDTENKTFVIDTAGPLAHNLPKTDVNCEI